MYKMICRKSQIQQWINTWTGISWFKNISSKSRSKFIKIDIVYFYPSITDDLLSKSLEYARTIKAIDEKVVKVIMHSRRPLLFDKDSKRIKRITPILI